MYSCGASYPNATWGIRGATKQIRYYVPISLKMEYPRAYKWNTIEYPRIFNDIPFMGLPQEYPYSYSPRRIGIRIAYSAWSTLPMTRIRLYSSEEETCIGLYTIFLLPKMQGVWHIQKEVEGGHILPNSRAIVLQQCGQCRQAGRMKG